MNETRQSLLLRAQTGETDAWKDLVDLYRPLILGLAQSPGRAGSAIWRTSARRSCSAWSSTCPAFSTPATGRLPLLAAHHRLQPHGRLLAGDRRGHPGQGGSGATAALQQIADPDSALNRQWDEEHDRYVLHCLLDLVEEEFEPVTLQAFRRLALDGVSGAEAAQELGLSVAAVYVAKSRVLRASVRRRKGSSTDGTSAVEKTRPTARLA